MMRSVSVSRWIVILVATLGSREVAFAHHAETMRDNPLLQGLSMPLHGLDHVLMAIGVGIITRQLGSQAFWAVPFGFSLVLVAGGLLNLVGISMPLLDQLLLASLLFAGAYLTLKHRLPAGIAMAIFPLLGAIHGNALLRLPGPETRLAEFFLFAGGCAVSALVLVFSGIALGGFLAKKRNEALWFRLAGTTLLAATLLIAATPDSSGRIIRLLTR